MNFKTILMPSDFGKIFVTKKATLILHSFIVFTLEGAIFYAAA